MKKGIFTISFMVIITIVFISALAVVNEVSKERIARNLEIEKYKSILYAFDIFPEGIHEAELAPTSTTADLPWDERHILTVMRKQIKTVRLPLTQNQIGLLKNSFFSFRDSVDIFIHLDANQKIVAYGFPLKGKGLWGTISAFAAISSDLTHMVGIDFTEQVETPGLGARITETEFKYLFRNLDLSGFYDQARDRPPILMVSKKSKTNVQQSTNSIQAITGATQTSNGVLDMINTDLRFYITVIKTNEQILSDEFGVQPLGCQITKLKLELQT